MSTERNAKLVYGWMDSSAESILKILDPLIQKLNLDVDDIDDLDYVFQREVEQRNKLKLKIEVVYGADGDETGDYYFGLSPEYIYDLSPEDYLKIMNTLMDSVNEIVKDLEIDKPKFYNVVSFF